MTLSLEKNPEQDFLGAMFMELNLGNLHSGQVFTPHDSCCGSGTLLISSANTIKAQLCKEGMNYQNHLFVVAQDIDQTVAQMCYIQLSLLGIAGFVKVGNSLTNPVMPGDSNENYWFTPMYFSNIWHTRRMIAAFKNLMEGLDNEKV